LLGESFEGDDVGVLRGAFKTGTGALKTGVEVITDDFGVLADTTIVRRRERQTERERDVETHRQRWREKEFIVNLETEK
jgi:hypothetical protein